MSDEHDNIDPLPLLVAQMDQAIMMTPMLARWAKALYDSFVSEGFDEDQALQLATIPLPGVDLLPSEGGAP